MCVEYRTHVCYNVVIMITFKGWEYMNEREILELANDLEWLEKNDKEGYDYIISLIKKMRQIGS